MKDESQVKTIVGLCLSILLGTLPAVADDAPVPEVSIITDTVILEQTVYVPRDFRPKAKFFPNKIGLALSGGGARGIAQIGVLKAFEEIGIDIAYIAGTSMGSIIGGLYASGYSAAEIEEVIAQIDFTSLFSDSPKRSSLLLSQKEERDKYLFSIRFDGFKPYIPRALTTGQRLTTYLTDLTIRANYRCGGDYDRLPIPYRAVATDIGAGEVVPINHGNLAEAMRASMGFPLAFTAVELEGRQLMDGGILNPIPVEVCREMGADFVVAVNTVSSLLPVDRINDPVDIANQITTIMSQDALARQLAEANFIITPRLHDLESFDFKMHDTLIALGYKAGLEAIAEFEHRLTQSRSTDLVKLRGLQAATDSPALQEIIRNFPVRIGAIFDLDRLIDALRFADRRKIFHQLKAEIIRNGIDVNIIISRSHHCSQWSFVIEYMEFTSITFE